MAPGLGVVGDDGDAVAVVAAGGRGRPRRRRPWPRPRPWPAACRSTRPRRRRWCRRRTRAAEPSGRVIVIWSLIAATQCTSARPDRPIGRSGARFGRAAVSAPEEDLLGDGGHERAVDRCGWCRATGRGHAGGHGHELGQQPLVDVDRAVEPHAVVERDRHPPGVVGQVGVRLAGGPGRAVVAEVGQRLEVQQRVVGHRRRRPEPGPPGVRDGVAGVASTGTSRDSNQGVVVAAAGAGRRGPGRPGVAGRLVLDAGLVVVEVGGEDERRRRASWRATTRRVAKLAPSRVRSTS